MKAASKRWILYGALILLFCLRFDFWNWERADIVLGLPISLLYHLLICILAAILLFLLTRYAWPRFSDSEGDDQRR